MEYIEIDIRLKLVNPYAEIFIARLNEIKYESFSTNEGGLKAYIRSDLFNIFFHKSFNFLNIKFSFF